MTKEDPQPASRSRGRRPTFDRSEALSVALDLFWRHGYEGVSISDLCEAIGIAPPSLYHAFGSKADLYREVLKLYGAGNVTADEIAVAPSARAAVAMLLERGVEAVSRPGRPSGCMISSGMLMASPENADLAQELQALRAETRIALEHRIVRDVAAGALSADTDAATLARFFATVLQGLSVQALDGAGRAELQAVAATALRAWPDGAGSSLASLRS